MSHCHWHRGLTARRQQQLAHVLPPDAEAAEGQAVTLLGR